MDCILYNPFYKLPAVLLPQSPDILPLGKRSGQ